MKHQILNVKCYVSMLFFLLIVLVGTNLGTASAAPTITASAAQPLTSANLDGSVVTLTLSGGTFSHPVNGIIGGRIVSNSVLGVEVSGIPGVTIPSERAPTNVIINGVRQYGIRYAIDRISGTQLAVELAFDGTLDSDATITFTVSAAAIENYNGLALTAEVPVTAIGEGSVSTPSHLFIYWTDTGTGKIQRANLDGSNVQDLVTQGLSDPYGIALDVAGGKMYWTDAATGKIQRANLDGSNVQNLVTQGLNSPRGIALDVAGGKMYWTDADTDKIQRANLDGSNFQDLIATGLDEPEGIALDVIGGKMYWADWGTDKIQRANLDGSNVQDLITGRGPSGIALDVAGGKMYWTDFVENKIQRANLDGSNVQDLVTTGLETPSGIVLDVAGGKMYWTDWGEIGQDARLGKEKIRRANLDGSNVEDLVTHTQGLNLPTYIAIGISPQDGGRVVASVASPLTEATLDGSVVTLTLTGKTYEQDLSKIRDAVTVSGITGVTIDTATVQRLSNTEITVALAFDGISSSTGPLTFSVGAGAIADYTGPVLTAEIPVTSTRDQHLFIYWTDFVTDKIQRANLDGSNVQDLVTQGLRGPSGIALDVGSGKMYWTDFGTDKIQRANLDGSNVQDLVTQGLHSPRGIALDVAGGKMYWTDDGMHKIQRANLDGSNVQDLVTHGLDWPDGIALDVGGGKMYWIDVETAKIQRANLDGSNVEDLVTRGLSIPVGIALDVAGGKMYWTDFGTDKIQRANLDGSNVEDLVTRGLSLPIGIALDVAGGKMYWTDHTTDKIQRANLDGSNVEDLITQGLDSPQGIALAIPAQTLPPTVREDVNRDGVISILDLILVAQQLGKRVPAGSAWMSTATVLPVSSTLFS